MPCIQLDQLPAPPPGKTGWPWTEESRQLPARMTDGTLWPIISIVTPSFNQGQFIEETIRSILLQGYANLEYLILDGGSTDGSVEIIQKYAPWLTYWVSEPDGGQSDAINRGLKRASGQFVTWINSDDMLCRHALVDHATRIGFDPNIVYAGICLYINTVGNVRASHCGRVHSLEDLVRVGAIWRGGGQIVQPEILFPRDMALSIGGLDNANHFTMDYDLWGKLLIQGAKFQYTQIPFGMFREHPEQKTHHPLRITESLLKTAAQLITLARCFSEQKKAELLADLDAYNADYQKACWLGTGRLARMGLPRELVTSLRALRNIMHSNKAPTPNTSSTTRAR